ncbi:MAG: hypothetical protein NUV65_00760 [Candidatus Roizmanbacteria bacterium]|nr:hypothetical protein [Candidatus Roizmanbacteria bacterium]
MEIGNESEFASETKIIVDNKPPFFDQIGVPLENVLAESRQYERSYLAFQAVRHAGKYVGFEPYLLFASAATEDELLINYAEKKLRALNKDPEMRRMVVQTLREERVYVPALFWLHSELGALTARLRAQMMMHQEGVDFRSRLHGLLENTTITYRVENGITRQQYTLPTIFVPPTIAIEPPVQNGSMFSPEEYLSSLGKVGHPLVRASLRHLK